MPTSRRHGATLALLTVLLAGGCGGAATRVGAAGETTTTAPTVPQVAACRSQVAQREKSGQAMVSWVPLSAELLNGGTGSPAVLRAAGVDDLGERHVVEAEPGAQVEQPHAVRFTGVQELAGAYDPSVEVYATPFALADAETLTASGASLLVVINETSDRADAGPIVAVTKAGDVEFPGDCHPAWARAFADYATRMNQPPVKIIEELLLHPTSPAADAFNTSPEGATLGGPTR